MRRLVGLVNSLSGAKGMCFLIFFIVVYALDFCPLLRFVYSCFIVVAVYLKFNFMLLGTFPFLCLLATINLFYLTSN